MAVTTIRGRIGLGPNVRGRALVADDNFSARYDLDREQGVFSRPTHKLFGQSYVGRVLVLNAAKGGVASAWMLREIALQGKAPLALLLNSANPVMVQGAAFAELTFMDRFEGDITAMIPSGAMVAVDPAAGLVTVETLPTNPAPV